MLMICPKANTKAKCVYCDHRYTHEHTNTCKNCHCDMFDNNDDEIVNCVTETKFNRKQKLEKINDNN